MRRAKPLTRSVSEMPGTTKSRPMPGRVTRFWTPSKRRLPGNSGTSSRVSDEHVHETRRAALGARVARPVGARRRHHQERRGGDERPRPLVERRHLLGERRAAAARRPAPTAARCDEIAWESASITLRSLAPAPRAVPLHGGYRVWHVRELLAPVASGTSPTRRPAHREARNAQPSSQGSTRFCVATVVRPWRSTQSCSPSSRSASSSRSACSPARSTARSTRSRRQI